MNLPKYCLRPLVALVFASTLLFSAGCLVVAAGAGAGTVAWVRGELSTSVDSKLPDVMKASKRAVEDMKFALVSDKQDVLTGEVVARTIEDTKVQITCKAETSGVTSIHIRVGVFGDQRVSQALLEKIKDRL